MERAEQQRLRKFIEDHDHGRAEGVPDFVIEAAREALTLSASDMPLCAECGEEATWETAGGITFCSDCPINYQTTPKMDARATWRQRYFDLHSRCEGATNHTEMQRMSHAIITALGADLI